MSNRGANVPEAVLRFAPVPKDRVANDGDPLDKTGSTILDLLHEAATIAEANCQHAVETAHKLSLRLRAAEDQIRDLQGDVNYYQDRAYRAEQWLQRIAEEINKEFISLKGGREPHSNRNSIGQT